MSSYNHIPKGKVRISPNRIIANDSVIANEEEYKRETIEHYVDQNKKQIENAYNEAMKELDIKKQEWFTSYQEQITREAIDKAKEELRSEYEADFNKAQKILEQANLYKKNLYEETESLKEAYLKEQEDSIVTLVFDLLRLLLEEVETERDVVLKSLRKMVKEMPNDSASVSIRVHPDVYERVKEKESGGFRFYADLSLNQCDFVVETESEYLDGTLTSRLEQLKMYIKGEGLRV
ncbi:hypothetical protein IMZ31_21030 (plasmid) [Pontibacillus sp. ALD_SL1]|uniref:FliH/SctL family protein n=1 Tax=Pontibacillus sp. ALD_SL1 TaxID=2777185 RepID=UPI001A96740D|nr:FliH/SctL family protein [Pontibacillus sp. ALD_SL1]QST03034.1 hypothetical protein IMZ31_21030 [Pontibacillus sp. ALD_SL1]